MSQTFKETPYWWEAAPLPEFEGAPVQKTCDVAIVGAGFAGLTAALILARAGRSVQVFDKERPGEGASSRNGGIVSGNIKMAFSDMASTFGEAKVDGDFPHPAGTFFAENFFSEVRRLSTFRA